MAKDSTCKTCKFRWAHFRPLPVTILSLLIYIPLVTVLLWIHYVPPHAPSSSSLQNNLGINITNTWQNLAAITNQFHPYNSHANDDVRTFLMGEIKRIIDKNGSGGLRAEVIDDNKVNVLYAGGLDSGVSIYFESTNIMVVVHGREDSRGKVLVNAHYDSVSTAPGTTDDGVGVVTVLGLIDYFTQEHHAPTRGLIFLLNNGEEDYLNGAVAFTQHPIAKSARIFLNLEGAGAGGRATLFRSSDAEVTRFFQGAKHPFGSSLSGDGFQRGFIKSQTDYIIFDGDLGMRGLDLAFWQPRARYHTQNDNNAHTSIDSVWHMLGTALDTVKLMAEDKSYEFAKDRRGSTGVWFDLFGDTFGVMKLHTLFTISMCLATITPALILLTFFLLHHFDRSYLVTQLHPQQPSQLPPRYQVSAYKGFFRYPLALILATGTVVAAAAVLTKVNPMIAYSSAEAVWCFFISLWFIIVWIVLYGMSLWRPSAAQRIWISGWSWLGWWAGLILVTVAEDRAGVGAGYFVLVYYTGAYLAYQISLIGLFWLPRKSELLEGFDGPESDNEDNEESPSIVINSPRVTSPLANGDNESSEPTESTPLFTSSRSGNRTIGRAPRSHGSISAASALEESLCSKGKDCSKRQYSKEQYWGRYLPHFSWIVELLVSLPVPLMFSVPLGLLLGTAMDQTGADGGEASLVYTIFALFSILVLVPLAPHMHRITWHIPAFLFFIFIGTGIYNLAAFPFSVSAPLKVYFGQSVDVTTGVNSVYLIGVDKYVKEITSNHIPSAWGKNVVCEQDSIRKELTRCSWEGLVPHVVPHNQNYTEWVIAHATRSIANDGYVKVEVNGLNTRACRLLFDRKLPNIFVSPANSSLPVSHRSPTVPQGGVRQIRLWSRDWGRGWKLDANAGLEKLEGSVVCLWSDVNVQGTLPAFDEVKAFLPSWAVVTKYGDGLLEGVLKFKV